MQIFPKPPNYLTLGHSSLIHMNRAYLQPTLCNMHAMKYVRASQNFVRASQNNFWIFAYTISLHLLPYSDNAIHFNIFFTVIINDMQFFFSKISPFRNLERTLKLDAKLSVRHKIFFKSSQIWAGVEQMNWASAALHFLVYLSYYGIYPVYQN